MLTLHTGAAWSDPAKTYLPARLVINRATLCRVRSRRRYSFAKPRLQPLRRPSPFRSATLHSNADSCVDSVGTQHIRTTVDDAVLIQGKFVVQNKVAELSVSGLHQKFNQLFIICMQALAGPAVIRRGGTTRLSSKYMISRYAIAAQVAYSNLCFRPLQNLLQEAGFTHIWLPPPSQSVSRQVWQQELVLPL